MGSNPIFDKNNFMKIKNKLDLTFLPLIRLHSKQYLTLSKHLSLILQILKTSVVYNFNMVSCITGLDLMNPFKRFCIIYELFSVLNNLQIQIKIFITPKEKVNSITSYFLSANWYERELWDLFGIFFTNHPDLRRILTDYSFEGHPFRRDFPLTGLIEILFLDVYGGLYSLPTTYSQKNRFFW
jgi:NADH/F420H2 dehydrogenase subunit C